MVELFIGQMPIAPYQPIQMKSICAFFLLTACTLSIANAADEMPKADAVVVKVLETPLPVEEKKMAAFLWEEFANKPEEQKFNGYTTEKWKETFSMFATALVEKARNQELDSASLRKILDTILKKSGDKTAYLPVGAYQTKLDSNLVWIVIVKWEYPPKDKSAKNHALGHICMYVFDQKTIKLVGSNTCL